MRTVPGSTLLYNVSGYSDHCRYDKLADFYFPSYYQESWDFIFSGKVSSKCLKYILTGKMYFQTGYGWKRKSLQMPYTSTYPTSDPCVFNRWLYLTMFSTHFAYNYFTGTTSTLWIVSEQTYPCKHWINMYVNKLRVVYRSLLNRKYHI